MVTDDPLCSRNARSEKDGKGSLVVPCSRNAHDRNVLVRRAQSRIDQASLDNVMGSWKSTRSGRSISLHPLKSKQASSVGLFVYMLLDARRCGLTEAIPKSKMWQYSLPENDW